MWSRPGKPAACSVGGGEGKATCPLLQASRARSELPFETSISSAHRLEVGPSLTMHHQESHIVGTGLSGCKVLGRAQDGKQYGACRTGAGVARCHCQPLLRE